MATYAYPESRALTAIAPDLIQAATLDDPILKYVFPITYIQQSKMSWTIDDVSVGLMALRGLDGEPPRVKNVGSKEYEAEPGYFGEFMALTETELTLRASMMPLNVTVPVDVTDLVAQRQAILAQRQANRIRWCAWTLALTGTIAIPLPTGGTGGIGYTETFTPQTFTPTVPWSTLATATPLADIRSLQPTFGFGKSTRFGVGSVMIMNTVTKNYLLGNTNAADLGGIRGQYGQTLNDLPGINNILQLQDLPAIITYDDGYYDESGTFQLYLPTGKVLIVGARPNGEKPGAFQMTRNINNPGYAPGPYAFVQDTTGNNGVVQTVPPKIAVHMGFNGGAVPMRPSQMVVATVI